MTNITFWVRIRLAISRFCRVYKHISIINVTPNTANTAKPILYILYVKCYSIFNKVKVNSDR